MIQLILHKHKGIWKQKPIFKILWNVQKPLRRESDTRPHPRRMLLISSQNTFVTNFATSCHIQVNILRTTEKLSTKLTNISWWKYSIILIILNGWQNNPDQRSFTPPPILMILSLQNFAMYYCPFNHVAYELMCFICFLKITHP